MNSITEIINHLIHLNIMKNIYVKTLEAFAKYKSSIGVILYSNPDQTTVNLYTGDKHLRVNRDEISIPTLDAIEKELNRNDELKELAYENNLIELHSQDAESYMNYVSTYN
jgi:hypothetical protein